MGFQGPIAMKSRSNKVVQEEPGSQSWAGEEHLRVTCRNGDFHE